MKGDILLLLLSTREFANKTSSLLYYVRLSNLVTDCVSSMSLLQLIKVTLGKEIRGTVSKQFDYRPVKMEDKDVSRENGEGGNSST